MSDINIRFEGLLPKGAAGLPNFLSLSQTLDHAAEAMRFGITASFRRSVLVSDELYLTSYPDAEPVESIIREGAADLLLDMRKVIDEALADLVD